ncbi:hypothetical protein EUAN_06770 [Andreesenia angusta]|uniref:Uncharacterized protein n=1 Tax=Andreesenia angusta TaxID=39480 RepID=A0A1S1V8G5_9FIRM|nr:hypothetical protein [Andreesenia angusta]OHW62893.1 hypothetical protein EUAN_06770 [Andreesenia angusta]
MAKYKNNDVLKKLEEKRVDDEEKASLTMQLIDKELRVAELETQVATLALEIMTLKGGA